MNSTTLLSRIFRQMHRARIITIYQTMADIHEAEIGIVQRVMKANHVSVLTKAELRATLGVLQSSYQWKLNKLAAVYAKLFSKEELERKVRTFDIMVYEYSPLHSLKSEIVLRASWSRRFPNSWSEAHLDSLLAKRALLCLN